MIDTSKAFALAPIKKKKAAKADKAVVYFIASTDFKGLTKIGRTGNHTQRINDIAKGRGVPLSALHYLGYVTVDRSNASKLERALHHHFDDKRRDGEWFDLSGANLLADTIMLCKREIGDGFEISGLASDIEEERPNAPPSHYENSFLRRRYVRVV